MVMTTIVRRVARSAVRGSQRVLAARAAPLAASQLLLQTQPRCFSSSKSEDGSHSDFQPQYHAAKSTEKDEILKMIESHVKTYPIMLYMKGTPSAPQCGFSMQVVRILHAQGVSFDSVNVLDHPEIREGVKEYSQWPTIPQLYVKGEFVGGCDIITDMSKSGELDELLAEFKKN
ncbi:Grx4 family monothiol glutaredoxin [Phytophthora cinnamomi]|uniref:Grx4 family monothiol glutaredoxin n=1 Tax=Phytophthora cinnamomi TaxID=4785 RepID=UPI00355A7111|nr:Grx4 family monothiol glutaredoxin [Phytophthora cinnamomi]